MEFSGIREGVIVLQPVQSGGGGEAVPRHGDRTPATTQAATALLASGPVPSHTVTLYLQHGRVSLLRLFLLLSSFTTFKVLKSFAGSIFCRFVPSAKTFKLAWTQNALPVGTFKIQL